MSSLSTEAPVEESEVKDGQGSIIEEEEEEMDVDVDIVKGEDEDEKNCYCGRYHR